MSSLSGGCLVQLTQAAEPVTAQSVTSDLSLFVPNSSLRALQNSPWREESTGSMDHPQGKNASRHETLGSRNLMEQFTGVRAKVDMYFVKVRAALK